MVNLLKFNDKNLCLQAKTVLVINFSIAFWEYDRLNGLLSKTNCRIK